MLYFPNVDDLAWLNIWELSPLIEEGICDEVNVLVCPLSSWFSDFTGCSFLWRFSCLFDSFCNKIVRTGSLDFAPKSELTCTYLSYKFLEALLKQKGVVFAK
jgi:hypothetical protein